MMYKKYLSILLICSIVFFTGCQNKSSQQDRYLYNDGGRIGIGGYDADMISYLINPPQLYFANVQFIPEFTSMNEGGVSLFDDDNLSVGVRVGYDTEDHPPIHIAYEYDLQTKAITKWDEGDDILSDKRIREISEQLYEIMSYAEENKAQVNLLD